MVVCKYFAGGYCKHGSRCRFEHVNSSGNYESGRSLELSSNERLSGTSILRSRNSYFSGSENPGFIHSPQQQNVMQKSSTGLRFNVQEVMAIVTKDILQVEKGSQWQLSSYSPLKDLPNIPGLEDHSPEELRWEFYKALQNGSLPLWHAIVQQLYANVAKVHNELNKKDTGYVIIDRWLREGENACLHTNLTSPYSNVNTHDLTSAAKFYNQTDITTARNSPFSFTLPEQHHLNIQAYSSRDPAFINQESVRPASNQNLETFSPQTAHGIIDHQVYCSVEELNESELEAFKADRFVFCSIPTKPPPKMFCNITGQ